MRMGKIVIVEVTGPPTSSAIFIPLSGATLNPFSPGPIGFRVLTAALPVVRGSV